MFLRTSIYKSTESYSDKVDRLRGEMASADAVLIGAGAGLSTSAGLSYSGERFDKYFSDFKQEYGIRDMYSGGFYPFKTLEEYWAWWSRHIYVNRYGVGVGKPYADLLKMVKDNDYFVLTTNVDHQFQMAGFDKKRMFYTQGDYGLWQCTKPCHKKNYDNEETVIKMLISQDFLEEKDGEYHITDSSRWRMSVDSVLMPHCPVCGAPMTMNLRCDETFVEDEGWHAAADRYSDFVRRHENMHILFLELGVGANTPVIIKYPFWRMTADNPKAVYACINYGEAYCPEQISSQAICIDGDIGKVLEEIYSG